MKRNSYSVICIWITVLILFCVISCTDFTMGSSLTLDTIATGRISGKVVYSDRDELANEGIVVTLDKTDGLRTGSVLDLSESGSLKRASRKAAGSTLTSSNGSYLFDNLEDGVYTIYACSPNSNESAVCKNVVVRSAGTTIAENLNLSATGSISGRITLNMENTGNAGFLVFIAGTSYMAMTDDYGNYNISGVPAGDGYMIVAMKNNVIHSINSDVTVSSNDCISMPDNNFRSSELEILGQQGEKGDDGENGKDGSSFIWLGAFDGESEISEPVYLNAYFNKTDGCSYIYTGTEWELLANGGANGIDCFSAITSVTERSTEDFTKQVVITVNLTKDDLLKIGYIYSVEEPHFSFANTLFKNADFVPITKDSDGKYRINAMENGYYTIVVKDSDGFVSYRVECVTNIDKIAPAPVATLRAQYNRNSKVLTVTWTNPSDTDFAYAVLSCKIGGEFQVENQQITDEIYSICNVKVDYAQYEFTIYTVDYIGNRSEISTVNIIPVTYSIGDVLLNDGTVIPYDAENLTFTDEQKQKAVGVLFDIDKSGKPNNWLGIYNSASGINSGEYAWAPRNTTGYNLNFTEIICTPINHESNEGKTITFDGDTSGRDNWRYICSIDSVGSGFTTKYYPAFDYVNNYAKTFGLKGDYATGWYMPSLAELYYIYKNKDILNSVLDVIDGVQLYNKAYWSSSCSSSSSWWIDLSNGAMNIWNDRSGTRNVCCVWSFDNIDTEVTRPSYLIGDVLLNDGTIVPYDAENLTFTEEQKQKAVGVLFDMNNGKPVWLGIYNSAEGVSCGQYQWAVEHTAGYETIFEDIKCSPSTYGKEGDAGKATFTGDLDGSDNWSCISSCGGVSSDFPAFLYVKNYANTFGLSGKYATGWYMPSLAELCYIYRNKDTLNSVINALDGIPLSSGSYWSSSQYNDSFYNRVWSVTMSNGVLDSWGKHTSLNVCCVSFF